MSEHTNGRHEHTGLKKNAIGWFSVFLMVITTNGPLTSMAGGVPASITLGNGIGLPGSYVIVCAAYLLFAVGFCAMNPYVQNAGAFYAYITKGLGIIPGVGGAGIAVFSYNAMLLACYGMLGHFMHVAFAALGIDAPWWIWASVSAVAANFLCVRGIEFSGRLLLLLMASEVGVILLADLLVLLHRPASDSLSLLPFSPDAVFTPGFGPSLIFVVASFMGFETAAIYSQEVRDPQRAVPLAMYSSILFIGLLFVGSIWLMLNHFGMSASLDMAAKNPGAMWLDMFATLAGPTAAKAAAVLVLTSLFAAVLSFTNVVTRYWHVLAVRGLVWQALSRTHVRHQSPHIASAAHTAVMTLLILVCAGTGLDPMLQVLPLASIPAAIGVLMAQSLTAIAIVSFFRKHRSGVSLWRSQLAPTLSAIILIYFLLQMILHVELLSGQPALPSYTLALSVVLVGCAVSAYAVYLRHSSPHRFEQLSAFVAQS